MILLSNIQVWNFADVYHELAHFRTFERLHYQDDTFANTFNPGERNISGYLSPCRMHLRDLTIQNAAGARRDLVHPPWCDTNLLVGVAKVHSMLCGK